MYITDSFGRFSALGNYYVVSGGTATITPPVPPPSSEGAIILFSETFSDFTVGGLTTDILKSKGWQLSQTSFKTSSQSIVNINNGVQGKVWHSDYEYGQSNASPENVGLHSADYPWWSQNSWELNVHLGHKYDEIWLDWDFWTSADFDGDGLYPDGYAVGDYGPVHGGNGGKMGGGFTGGLRRNNPPSDLSTGETAVAWWTHPVWGSSNNLMTYTYDLTDRSYIYTGGSIATFPWTGPLSNGWSRFTARCVVSTPGKTDGFVEYFKDGVYTGGIYNIYMRSIEQGANYGQPEQLWFSYFFGGNHFWSSKQHNEIAMTNIVVSTHGPSSSRYKGDASYGTGQTIAELRYAANLYPSPLCYSESRTSPAGTVASHYEVDWPPQDPNIYTKTITTPYSPIKIVWDYYRLDMNDADDGMQDSSCSIFYGAGDTHYASYNYASRPTIGSTYTINSSTCKIRYCPGTNRGETNSNSKGWKFHYASPSTNICVVGDSTALTVYTYLVATGLYDVCTIAVEGIGSVHQDASWNNNTLTVGGSPWNAARKLGFDYVIVQNGLNDIVQVDDLSDANVFNYFQTLINDINRDTKANCKLIVSTMTPNKTQIYNTWGPPKDASAYRRWIALNESIKGNSGPWYPALTGIDVVNPNNTIDLNDTSDNLQVYYQRGGGDYVHPNNYAVQYVEVPNYQQLMN